MKFVWDPAKETNNLIKHGVTFETVPFVFADPKRLLFVDRKHNQKEARYFCIGSDGQGILTVRFTLRAGEIRVIGAGYWQKGKKLYEKATAF